MRKTLKLPLTAIAIAIAFFAGWGFQRWFGKSDSRTVNSSRKVLYYVDAMHPWYKSDKPGIAPDCGMKLEPVYADGGITNPTTTARKILRYRDPRDLTYTSDKPGINPETGNDLEPVFGEDATTIPEGALQVTAEKQQLIGLRYGQASYQSAFQGFRSVGRVALDETRTTRVHARVEGWIERVHANFVGELVKKGQPLLTLYSPELLATQREFLLALQARTIMNKSSMHEAQSNSESLVAAARRRLELWNFNDGQIAELEKSGRPAQTVTLFAPAAGFITARNAFPGQKISPDTELYALADLSRIWVMADVFESDAPILRLGLPATVTSPNDPSIQVEARVSYIQPQVDASTRTLKARLELNNPGYKLKPEQFVDVSFRVAAGRMLSIPREALLDSGNTQTVFVDRGNGFLEPRRVQVGRRLADRVEIVSGLSTKDRIVVSGAFLLNSESQLKSAMDGMASQATRPGKDKGGAND